MRLQPLTLDEVCTSLSILDDVGIVKVEGRRDMLKRTVSTPGAAFGFIGAAICSAAALAFVSCAAVEDACELTRDCRCARALTRKT